MNKLNNTFYCLTRLVIKDEKICPLYSPFQRHENRNHSIFLVKSSHTLAQRKTLSQDLTNLKHAWRLPSPKVAPHYQPVSYKTFLQGIGP